MFPHRADDTLAAGFAYTGLSNDVHDFEGSQDLANARNFEALFEICYTAQLRKGWTLQPDFQYIWQPGGHVPEPSGRGTVPNAAVWGVRTTINF
jgi:porin